MAHFGEYWSGCGVSIVCGFETPFGDTYDVLRIVFVRGRRSVADEAIEDRNDADQKPQAE